MEFKDIQYAQSNIKNMIHHTPILTSQLLDTYTHQQVYLKAEHLQKTGAFKIRGATNRVKQAVENGAKVVVTASSGNHGQAVAYISQQLAIKCVVAVPEDASPLKVQAIKTYAAEVVYVGKTSEERMKYAKNFAESHNAVYIPPYDDTSIMAGQGTIGLEILEQVEKIDQVLVPVGGGGLISGIATAIKSVNPSIKVIGVEPESGNDTYLSMEKGMLTPIDAPSTIADGLKTIQPGELTFPIVQKYVDDIVLVKDEEIKEAMQFLFERMKQVVEPSGAVTLAAIMTEKITGTREHIVPVISGGNIALKQLVELFK